MGGKRKWTTAHINYLRKIAHGKPRADILRLFNAQYKTDISMVCLYRIMNKNGIHCGIKTTFKKGLVPHNKGQKGYCAGKRTWFKAGNVPPATAPIGTVSKEDGILKIKVKEPNGWVFFNRAIYEYFNGAVPEGHVVIFGDGNKMNYSPENLIAVSRAQLIVMNQNHLIYNNADLTKVGALVASVKMTVNKCKQKHKRKGQDVKAKPTSGKQ